MSFRSEPSSANAGSPNFDLFRRRIEAEVSPPSVLAIKSSTSQDGKEVAARGLANSLVAAGYTTLYLDTRPDVDGAINTPQRFALEEVGRLLPPESEAGKLAILSLGDLLVQKATSQRQVRSALEALRGKFDYVVINAEYGGCVAFAESVIASADAVLVTVKKGRHKLAEDAKLADALEQSGAHFLGVVAIDPSAIGGTSVAPVAGALPDWRLSDKAPRRKPQLREILEWPT